MIKQKLKVCNGCKKPKHIWKNVDGKKYCRDCAPKKSKKVSAPRKFIKPVSDKKSKKDVVYTALRIAYLKFHPLCEAHLENCTNNSTEVHHKKGRGEYYLDDSTFLAVCRSCHTWIENNPKLAIELNLSEKRLNN